MSSEALLSLIELHLPAAQTGDQVAYGQIVSGCQRGITAIALSIVRDIQASEDIAQDAFLNAWTNLKSLRSSSSFLPWLRQITRNLARDHLRRRVTEKRYDGDMDTILAVVADPTPDHPELLSRQHEEAVVAELIDNLPEETREILLIYYREGQSSKHVATLLGMQDAAVRKRLSRARLSLRDELLERLGRAALATAPGVAFTTLVVAGLTVSQPAAAAVAAGSAAAVGKGLSKFILGTGIAGKGASRLLFGLAGGVLFALVVGVAAVLFGVRRHWTTAIDAEEKRQLSWFAVAGVGLVVLLTGLMSYGALSHGIWGPTAVFAALVIALGAMNLLWLPRILARRHAIEARNDPLGARLARINERKYAWWGMAVGVVLGSAGIAGGLALMGGH
ncbi:MAG: RNA polymerase sigma factor [Pseudomarimonas sp.]